MVVSFPIMFFLVVKFVSDTNYFTEDAVIPPDHVRKEAETKLHDIDGDLSSSPSDGKDGVQHVD
jgi:hypothetical protein